MYKALVFTALLGASAMTHTVGGADLKTKSARAIDGGVNYLLHRAMLPKVVPARTARGGVIKVPSANYQTAHAALTVLGLMSAGYETCDNTAEGFAMREETSFLLSSGRQGADGYWGGTDRSMMFGHGLSLLAISELLQSGNVVDNRTEASIRASFAGRMSIRSQRGGAWSAVPPVGGEGTLGTVVSAIQVLGLKSLASLGGADPKVSLHFADQVFEQCVLRGGHHFDGTFSPGEPLPLVTRVACVFESVLTFHSFNETAAGAVTSMAVGSTERLSFMDRLAGLHGITGRYMNGLMPLQPRDRGRVISPVRYAYHGLGTMFLAWTDAGASYSAGAKTWIRRTVTDAQFANGTWSTYGEELALPLNGVLPSTAYAVLALSAGERRLPMLKMGGRFYTVAK